MLFIAASFYTLRGHRCGFYITGSIRELEINNQASIAVRKIAKPYLFIIIVLFSLNSCTTPSEKFAHLATDLQYQQQVIETPLFKHQIFANLAATQNNKSTTVHVYLDGDGTPWKNQRWLSKDPTSRNPLILRLMQLDKSPTLLLGRPCYHGLSGISECNPKYWTSHRYSTEVVQSMALALNTWLKKHDYRASCKTPDFTSLHLLIILTCIFKK